MTITLDDLKDRLYRSFGVEVRPDLQVRAGIIIQPEEGRWVFTPDELRDSGARPRVHIAQFKPGSRMAVSSHAQAIHRAVQSLIHIIGLKRDLPALRIPNWRNAVAINCLETML